MRGFPARILSHNGRGNPAPTQQRQILYTPRTHHHVRHHLTSFGKWRNIILVRYSSKGLLKMMKTTLLLFFSIIFLCGIVFHSNAYEFHWEIDETPEGQESATIVEYK